MKKLLLLIAFASLSLTAVFAQTNVVTIDGTNRALLISSDLSTDRAIEVIPGLQISRVYVIDVATAKVGIRTIDGRETTITLTRLSNSTYSAGDAAALTAFLGDLMDIMSPPTDEFGTVAAVNAVTTTTTLDASYSFVKADATSAAFTITLPPAANSSRVRYVFNKIDATVNDVTIDGNASETIDGLTTAVLKGQWSTLAIVSDGTNWFSEAKDQHKLVATTTTATLTASSSDGLVTADATGGAYTITLPAAALYEGRSYSFVKIDATAGDVTIDGNASETIDGVTTYLLKGFGTNLKLTSDGAGWYVMNQPTGNRINTRTTTYTATYADETIIADGTAGAFSITLPTAVGCEGRKYTIKSIHANDVTVDGDGSETIDGATTYVLETIQDWVTIQSNGVAWFVLAGN